MAKYAQACNIFSGPDFARKLDVLRAHCEAEGRNYDEIEKTVLYNFDVGEKGERAGQIVEDLHQLAELGAQVAIGSARAVSDLSRPRDHRQRGHPCHRRYLTEMQRAGPYKLDNGTTA